MSSWYINRLRSMSLPELFFRARQMFQSRYERLFCIGWFPRKIEVQIKPTDFRYSQKSDLLNPEHISIFGKKFDYTAKEIDWHLDLFSGKQFPLTFAKTINIRSNPDLSAKNVWEVNRLQFLRSIALDYAHTGDKKVPGKVYEYHGLHGLTRIHTLLGVNWYSNIEVNIAFNSMVLLLAFAGFC